MTVQATEAPAAPPADPAAAPAAPPPAPAAPPAAPAAPQQQAPAAAPAQPAAPAVPAPPAEPDWKAQAEAAKAEAARLKAEADRWKAQSRQQEARSKANHAELKNRDAVLRQIAEKVGIEFDDKPDPEVLTQRLTEAQQVARQRTVELAVYTTAAGSGANAAALLDSREFMSRTALLDPEAADFPSQVAELVRAVSEDPRYRTAPPPQAAPPAPAPAAQQPGQQAAPAPQPPAAVPPAASSGADFSGAPGGNRLWTQADYDYWATGPGKAQDRDGKIMARAIQDGLLVNLGVGKPRRPTRR